MVYSVMKNDRTALYALILFKDIVDWPYLSARVCWCVNRDRYPPGSPNYSLLAFGGFVNNSVRRPLSERALAVAFNLTWIAV